MSEFKYNVSVKVGDTQLTARADTLDEVEAQMMELRDVFGQKSVSSQPSEPQGISESHCEAHNVEMKERQGQYGKFYSHAQEFNGVWKYCSGKGWK